MMDRDWQRAFYIPLTILAWLAVIVVTGWLLGHIVKTILTLVFSAIVAFALTPVVNFLSRFMPRLLAIAIAYILGFAVILGLGALLVYNAAEQITSFVNHVPYYQKQAQQLKPHIISILKPFGVNNQNYNHTQQQAVNYIKSAGTSIAAQSLSIVTGVLGTLVDIVLTLILSVYLTANGHKISVWLRSQTPSPQRRNTVLLIGIVSQVVGGYIRGTLTLATLIGVLVGVGMYILHVNYAVLLGILAFFMEFVPVVGVLVSGAVCVGVALFQGWVLAVIVLAYFVVVHVIEGDVVGPRILGKAVGIHPATALVALVAGTELFGIWGALFGSPLAGLLQAIGTAAYRQFRGQDPTVVLNDVKEEAEKAADEGALDTDLGSVRPPPPEPASSDHQTWWRRLYRFLRHSDDEPRGPVTPRPGTRP
jgi:predicted PurR-regulated permease PerM